MKLHGTLISLLLVNFMIESTLGWKLVRVRKYRPFQNLNLTVVSYSLFLKITSLKIVYYIDVFKQLVRRHLVHLQ